MGALAPGRIDLVGEGGRGEGFDLVPGTDCLRSTRRNLLRRSADSERFFVAFWAPRLREK